MVVTPEALQSLFGFISRHTLGGGCSRQVYALDGWSYVIKIEDNDPFGMMQNVAEALLWRAVTHTPQEKWFAPCEWISADGRVLVMAKTTPPKRYPERLPTFMSDIKKENFGIYKGRFVVHDYGCIGVMLQNGFKNDRLVKVNWD